MSWCPCFPSSQERPVPHVVRRLVDDEWVSSDDEDSKPVASDERSEWMHVSLANSSFTYSVKPEQPKLRLHEPGLLREPERFRYQPLEEGSLKQGTLIVLEGGADDEHLRPGYHDNINANTNAATSNAATDGSESAFDVADISASLLDQSISDLTRSPPPLPPASVALADALSPRAPPAPMSPAPVPSASASTLLSSETLSISAFATPASASVASLLPDTTHHGPGEGSGDIADDADEVLSLSSLADQQAGVALL